MEDKNNGEQHYCPNCKKVQPIVLTNYNPDEDEQESLIVCKMCLEAIDFIENL